MEGKISYGKGSNEGDQNGLGSIKSTCAPMNTFVYHFKVANKQGTMDGVA